jgi:hypothetical protein
MNSSFSSHCILLTPHSLFFLKDGDHETRDSRGLVQEALAPEKMAEAQHTAMGTRTRSPCPTLALKNAPQKDAIHEDRARAFQKEKTSCQGRPMKAHALPCLKPLMICTLPRSPYARQHDAMRCWCCCHAHGLTCSISLRQIVLPDSSRLGAIWYRWAAFCTLQTSANTPEKRQGCRPKRNHCENLSTRRMRTRWIHSRLAYRGQTTHGTEGVEAEDVIGESMGEAKDASFGISIERSVMANTAASKRAPPCEPMMPFQGTPRRETQLSGPIHATPFAHVGGDEPLADLDAGVGLTILPWSNDPEEGTEQPPRTPITASQPEVPIKSPATRTVTNRSTSAQRVYMYTVYLTFRTPSSTTSDAPSSWWPPVR